MKIKAIFFDLDDTLFDTYGQLVESAIRDSCQVMIQAGLKANMESCIEKRHSFYLNVPRKNLYQELVTHFGVSNNDPESVAEIGQKAFFEREIEPTISLFSGAKNLLEDLEAKYHLFLVTAGDTNTQKQKVKHLGIEKFFRQIYYVDVRTGQTKKDAFTKALSEYYYKPKECLSVGNRIDHEIAEAKELGMHTCYIKHGQYVYLSPKRPEEIPDFTIDKIRDLMTTCRL
ncbi:MAG: HAD family hydrolase [Bdellovibrionales bacterium]|nr:HAD family hydrolase [Bdellovibrionales bacterium]